MAETTMGDIAGTDATYRTCLRDPIPEIADAARYLDAATTAHSRGQPKIAEELIRLADMPAIREWTESIWANDRAFVRFRDVSLPTAERAKARMPTAAEKQSIHARDGYHCRFCGIPVIRREVRVRVSKFYPLALTWGSRNVEQHAAFQAMWAQYDHVVPHAKGGQNELGNMVLTCAPCNFGRMSNSLEEVGLLDPRTRQPVRSLWDGLERFR
jgi:HNH endonuclease